MIQILGIKRILTLLILAGINAALAAGVYLFFIPHNQQLGAELTNLTSQVSAKRADTERLQSEYQVIQEQKVYFSGLEAAGFFSDQNRAVARQRVNDIQRFTNVLSAKYNITSAQVEKTALADEAGYVVLNSPVTVDVEALDDVDFYTFVYWLENAFPGHVSVKTLKAERSLDVNEATLRSVGNGTPAALIKGSVSFDWRTMIPADKVAGTSAPKG